MGKSYDVVHVNWCGFRPVQQQLDNMTHASLRQEMKLPILQYLEYESQA